MIIALQVTINNTFVVTNISSLFNLSACFKTLFAVSVLSLIFVVNANAQKLDDHGDFIIDTADKVDIIDVVKDKFSFGTKKIKRSPGKKVYFSLLPVSSSIPGGGKALITSTSAGFYLGDRRNTYLSNVTFSPYLNFKGRYALSFRSNIYTSKNLYNIQGDTRFSLYPEYVYGDNGYNNEKGKLLITYKYIRFYHTVLKKIRPYLLVGVGYNMDYHINIKAAEDTIAFTKFMGYDHGTADKQNTFSSGITFNLLYDTRNNALNPLPGGYLNLIYRVNPYFLGNGNNTWKSIYLDTRKYISLPGQKRHVLAFWNYIWTALDNNVPYLDLPAIGYEPYQRSGRGIDQNRYRGKSMVYLESEYRSDITQNGLFGFVVFANATTTSGPADSKFRGVHPAAGAGLRIKFNKRSNTNIAVDFGVSRHNTGVTFNLGEAF